MDRDTVVEAFEEIAELLALLGENPFKIRSYENAARALSQWNGPMNELVQPGRVNQIKGIGSALKLKIKELADTGRLDYLEKLRDSLPEGLTTLLELPGLGPKKVRKIHLELGICSLEELEQACKEEKISQLAGFGKKFQDKLLDGIAFRRRHASLHLMPEALALGETLLQDLRDHPDVIRCSLAGDLRRGNELIETVELLASSKKPESVIAAFVQNPHLVSVATRTISEAGIVFPGGIWANLKTVPDAEYPFALIHDTGNQEHLEELRRRAEERGLHLARQGLTPSATGSEASPPSEPCRTEEAIYHRLELSYVPPELRENRGEIAAAEQNEIPRLLQWTELRGSLHNHSDWSDGEQSLRAIVDHCLELGCDYWAITDHSRSLIQARGLSVERLERQITAIDDMNDRLQDEDCDFRLLPGSEVDINAGGKLDYEDDLLAKLEVVVASLHRGFSQNQAQNTDRLIQAVSNPFVQILGHMTGRMLFYREPYPVDQEAVIKACAQTGTWIELNASPSRFDLDWRLWRSAKEQGVRCVVNCDAHREAHAANLRFGAIVARKGWLAKEDVMNTLPLNRLRTALGLKRQRG